MGKCSKFLDKVREDRYNRVKARQVRKFNNLFSKTKASILSNNDNNREAKVRGKMGPVTIEIATKGRHRLTITAIKVNCKQILTKSG